MRLNPSLVVGPFILSPISEIRALFDQLHPDFGARHRFSKLGFPIQMLSNILGVSTLSWPNSPLAL